LTVKAILNHPRWRMGKKITVDSATMMNKGFEVIEAQRLFSLSVDEIEVIVHPEAIVHSMVAYRDGSVIAQMGVPDMRLPIQYALTYPDRIPTGLKPLDLVAAKRLTFLNPDPEKFPALGLAFRVAKQGGTLPAVLNAADEVAVEAFLRGAIAFPRIYSVLEETVGRHDIRRAPSLEEILQADLWAREEAGKMIREAPPVRI
jgi:1-deoxy-D-xylulose-5-phosphate reductoisomerase